MMILFFEIFVPFYLQYLFLLMIPQLRTLVGRVASRVSWAPSMTSFGLRSDGPAVRRWCGTTIQGTKAREAYLFVYTCKVCGNRSERKISKRAYHHGVVLVQCPGCQKHHLVADNLKWFEDAPVNIQSLMERQGESVFTGTVEELIEIDGITKEAIEARIASSDSSL
jgi:hypothetical protein